MSPQITEIDNVPFHILHEGPPSGPLIVLSHALMANLHMWDSTVHALHSLGYSTLRYDHIGHNLTALPANGERSYHFDDFTRHIHSMVQRICPNKDIYAIIGCSIGGVLAIRYAIMFPGQVEKVISCGAPGMTSLEESKPKWEERITKFRTEGVENLAKLTVDRWFPDPCPDGVKTEALKMTRSCNLVGYEIYAHGVMRYDYTSELAAIDPAKTQVMVLVGENDEAVGPREVLEDVARRIRGSKYVMMKDVGHLSPVQGREEFEKILEELLGKAAEGR